MKEKAIEVVHVQVELKAGLTGEFSGYAAIFGNRDLNNDIVLPGAFAETLKIWASRGQLPRVRWMHGESIGHSVAVTEDERGLLVSGQIWVDDAEIAELYQDRILSERGVIGLSFIFVVTASTSSNDGHTVIRTITALDLMDDITISPFPVNTRAGLIEAKGATVPNVRRAEVSLRDAGFSRAQAKGLLSGQRDAGGSEDLSEILAALERTNASLSV